MAGPVGTNQALAARLNDGLTMAERMVIVIEYDVGPNMQQAITDAMTQIAEATDHLKSDHVKAVQVHVGIKECAERVMAVFRKDDDG